MIKVKLSVSNHHIIPLHSQVYNYIPYTVSGNDYILRDCELCKHTQPFKRNFFTCTV